jgi:hypothetical protein
LDIQNCPDRLCFFFFWGGVLLEKTLTLGHMPRHDIKARMHIGR